MEVRVVSNVAKVGQLLDAAIENALSDMGMVCSRYAQDKAPVYTGRLRNSIRYEVKKSEDALIVGTDVNYAGFVELGTSRQKPQPYLRPAVADHIDEYRAIVKRNLES